jgi:hypothetical protein
MRSEAQLLQMHLTGEIKIDARETMVFVRCGVIEEKALYRVHGFDRLAALRCATDRVLERASSPINPAQGVYYVTS